MKNRQDYEALRRFLLGELSEEEADRIEERVLADDELFELACAAEERILDDCAHGKLRRAECDRLAARLARSKGGRERVELARALAKLAADEGEEEEEERPRRVKLAAALAAGLVAALLCTHMVLPHRQDLSMRQLRGSTVLQTVWIIFGRRTALHVEPGFAVPGRAFHAAIVTPADQPVWSDDGLRPDADGNLVLNLPPFRLAPGRHRLIVTPEGGGHERKKEFLVVPCPLVGAAGTAPCAVF